MNGVISASVSAGSSQRSTSMTWTPMANVPSGGAAETGTTAARAVFRRAVRRYDSLPGVVAAGDRRVT
jgi:hypothetical protein